MRDLKRMRERFFRDGSSVRLGNLASDLLRLNKWILMRYKDEAIVDLMREIAWLMEWSGDLALAELADMQREICGWRRAWPIEQARPILALRASQMSSRILEWSGLPEQTTPGLKTPNSSVSSTPCQARGRLIKSGMTNKVLKTGLDLRNSVKSGQHFLHRSVIFDF
jgi:hypothetical protein